MVAVPAGAEEPSQKIDRALRASLQTGALTQHVIVTVKLGYRTYVQQSLERHGDRITSEHRLIDALAAEIHSADVEELARQPWVKAVSIDAIVEGHGGGNNMANPA